MNRRSALSLYFRSTPLYVLVPGGSARAFYTKALSKYRGIAEIYLIFPASTNLLLTYQFFLCSQPSGTITTIPNGSELTSDDVASGLFVGDNIAYSIPMQVDLTPSQPYLALWATNGLSGQLAAAAIAIMELQK